MDTAARIAANLGTQQVQVLRAAAKNNEQGRYGLAWYDTGQWAEWGRSGSLSRPAGTVWRLGLLAEGERMARAVLKGGQQPGRWMCLSPLGKAVWQAWQQQHPEVVAAEQRRREAILRLARQAHITAVDVLTLAANDRGLNDDAYVPLARALDGRDPITGEKD